MPRKFLALTCTYLAPLEFHRGFSSSITFSKFKINTVFYILNVCQKKLKTASFSRFHRRRLCQLNY